jgi:phage anti-repressor protein
MSHALINVVDGSIGGCPTKVVDARELHGFMQVGKVFGAWINERIQQYQFSEGIDFDVVFSETGKNPAGGRPPKDYRLSLNMAKELAMVERTDKGRGARRYFIACEEELRRIKSGGQDADNPFEQLDAHALDSLRRVNKTLAQAYLVKLGITPAFVAGVLGNPESPNAGFRGQADRAPLEILRAKVPEFAAAQDDQCWYLYRHDWEAICNGYSALRTARWLADMGLLRHDEGKLTMKAGANLFGQRGNPQRRYVYAVRKSLVDFRPVALAS